MTKFDPYQRWLGIPPQDQPPHFYRLLGLELFEEDPQVIKAAADNATAFIQQNAFGEELQQSQKLLSDIEKVAAYLLSPPHKTRYDSQLKVKLGIATPETPAQQSNRQQSSKPTQPKNALPQESLHTIQEASPSSTSSQQQNRQSGLKLLGFEISYRWLAVGAIGFLALTILLGMQFVGSDSPQQAGITQPAPASPAISQTPKPQATNNPALTAKANNPAPKNVKQPEDPKPAPAKPNAPMPPPAEEFTGRFTVNANTLHKKPGKRLADVTVDLLYQPGLKKEGRLQLGTFKTDATGQGELKVKLTPKQQTGKFLVKLTRKNESWERNLNNFPNELAQTLTIPVAIEPEYLNPDWIEQRLTEVNIDDLIAEYRKVNDPSVQAVASALDLSRSILHDHPEALREQLQYRLFNHPNPELIVFQILPNQKINFRSEWPTFREAGGEPLIRTLKSGIIDCLTMTPDGKFAVTGENDRLLSIWDTSSGKIIRSLKGHTGRLTCVAVTPDGKQIVSGSGDKTLKIWEFETGKLIHTLKGHLEIVNCLALTPDGKQIVSGGYDKNLMQWDLATGTLIRTIDKHKSLITSVAISPDGKLILSTSHEFLLINNSDTGKRVHTIKNESRDFSDMVITPDGKYVISGYGQLKKWDLESGKIVQSLEEHMGGISSLALSPNGEQLVASLSDLSIYVWDIASGKKTRRLRGHTDLITQVAISPDGKQVISASRDRSLRLWNLEGNRETPSYPIHNSAVNCIAISSDGKQAISGANDELKVWDLDSGKLLMDFKGTSSSHRWISYLPDENYAISGWSGMIFGWDLKNGAKLQESELERIRYYNAVAVTPDGKRGITVSEDNGAKSRLIRVWDLTRLKQLYGLKGHQERIHCLAVSAEGRRLVSVSVNELKVWDLGTGALLHTFQDPVGNFGCLALSPDGRYALTTAYVDKRLAIQVLDLVDKKLLHSLKGHTLDVTCLAFTPDGTLVVSSAKDKTIRLWDPLKGSLLATYAFDDLARNIAVGPDNRTLLVGCTTGRIHKIIFAMPGEINGMQQAIPPMAQQAAQNPMAQQQQNSLAKSLDKKIKITNTLEMHFALIPAGKFMMGGGKSAAEIAKQFDTKPSYFEQEYPQHEVEISKPFYMGMQEVTIDDFKQFVKMTGYKTDSERSGNGGTGWDEATKKFITRVPEFNWIKTGWLKSEFHPVVNVSWNDAVNFCEWLSQREKTKYRLPTEAEWEYACRAGTTSLYSHGDDVEGLVQFGNIWDGTAGKQFQANYSHLKSISSQDGFAFTAPVGSFEANAWSLYDMHGNVMEWCSDWYDEDYYKSLEGKTSIDLQGPPSGSDHVVRGGSWAFLPQYAHAAYRFRFSPSSYANHIGFRIVREVE
ncbi:MAG: SUMF1/EgtB/PvdO family nonheme iron enzyme [Planctomycetota bacterium]